MGIGEITKKWGRQLAAPLLASGVVIGSLFVAQDRNEEFDLISEALVRVDAFADLVASSGRSIERFGKRSGPITREGAPDALEDGPGLLKDAMRAVARLDGGNEVNRLALEIAHGQGKGLVAEIERYRQALSSVGIGAPKVSVVAPPGEIEALRIQSEKIVADMHRYGDAARDLIARERSRASLAQLLVIGALMAMLLLERVQATLGRDRSLRLSGTERQSHPDPSQHAVLLLDQEAHCTGCDSRFMEMLDLAHDSDPAGRPVEEIFRGLNAQLNPGGKELNTQDPAVIWKQIRHQGHGLLSLADGRIMFVSLLTRPTAGWQLSFMDLTQHGETSDERVGGNRDAKFSAACLHQLSVVAEHTRDMILLCRAGGIIVWANPAFIEMTGFEPDDVIGQTMRLQIGAGTNSQESRLVMRAFSGVEAISCEILLYNKDGSQYWAELSISPALDEDGRPYRYICAQRDITQRRATKERLAESEARAVELAARAEAANHAKSSFLAKMSHEIRTPMNGVIGMSELLAETELSEDQRIYLDAIRQSGEALLVIINDVLDFSKIEADHVTLELAPFDFSGMLEDLLLLSSARASENLVEVVLNYAESLPECFVGDAGRIRQILTNLIGNAVKFTPSGSIVVSVTGTVIDGLATLEISVKDTGIGIAAADLPRIFAEFAQATDTENGRFEGTGLGMAIADRLVSLMEGDIWVESELGVGSTFFVRLPLPVAIDLPVTECRPRQDVTGIRVLAVDDHEANLNLLRRRLEAWGMTVETSIDPLAALETIRDRSFADRQFDLVLLDRRMPGMDGVVLGREIRQIDNDVPMLLLSSVEGTDTPGSEGGSVFAGQILKPLRAALLANAISDALDGDVKKDLQERRSTSTGRDTEINPAATVQALPRREAAITVLIAEDNRTNQMVISSMLRDENCIIHIVENGTRAVDAFCRLAPDVVFMDVQMPGLDGFEATARIRSIEEERGCAHTPVIALTANALSGDRERCLNAGMDDYVTKPASKAALVEALNRHVRHRDGDDGPSALDYPAAASRL